MSGTKDRARNTAMRMMMMPGRGVRLTFALLCLVILQDKADLQLLPAVYTEVCREFDSGPMYLGFVTTCRGFAQSAAAVLAGPLAARFDRVMLVSVACCFWALATVLVGAARTPLALLLARSANGAGLGIAIPLIFSLVADLAPEPLRGRAFGFLLFCSNVGGTIGAYAATELAGSTYGWRAAFYGFGALSFGAGVLLYLLGVEPRASGSRLSPTVGTDMVALRSVFRIRTFAVILLQGAIGTTPWYSLSFLTMLLSTLLGHHEAAVARGRFDLGTTFGTLLGGLLNDHAGRVSPLHGRIYVAQVSVAAGVPLFLLVLYLLPSTHAPPLAYGATLLVTGLLITWCQGVNNTIMAEVVPAHMRAHIYGLDRMCEGLIAPAGALLAGWLAEAVFGFQQASGCGPDIGTSGAAQDMNAAALGNALACMTCVPWAFCFLAYTLLHWTYPADRCLGSAPSVTPKSTVNGSGDGGNGESPTTELWGSSMPDSSSDGRSQEEIAAPALSRTERARSLAQVSRVAAREEAKTRPHDTLP